MDERESQDATRGAGEPGKATHLLVELLGEDVNAEGVLGAVLVLPESELREDLITEKGASGRRPRRRTNGERERRGKPAVKALPRQPLLSSLDQKSEEDVSGW